MRPRPKKIFYVEAVGHTNGAIAAELPTENAHKGVMCRDGRKRDLWRCEYSFITKLLKCEVAEHLDFAVFCQDRPNGPVKPWPFLRRQKLTLERALKKGVVTQGVPRKAA